MTAMVNVPETAAPGDIVPMTGSLEYGEGNGLVEVRDETAIVDSTAHALKFSGFQDMYFQDSFPEGFAVRPNPALVNRPRYVHPEGLDQVPEPGKQMDAEAFNQFVDAVARKIATELGLKKKD